MKMIKIKQYWKIVFLICLIASSVAITKSVLSKNGEEIVVHKMHLTIGESPGFDVTTELIEFGRVPPIGSAKKTLILNNRETTKLVHITATGKLKNLVQVSENNFIMHPGESKDLGVLAIVPADAKYGEYNGKLRIKFTEVEDEI
jgi:hypothetical protein